MEIGKPVFNCHLVVCEKQREGKAACAPESLQIRESLKEAAEAAGLSDQIRVVRSGCLEACAKGPNALFEPAHKMYHSIKPEDVPAIIEDLRKEINV